MLYEAGDLVENTVRDRWRGFGYLQSLGARSQLFYSQHATFNNVYFDLCHLYRTVVLIRCFTVISSTEEIRKNSVQSRRTFNVLLTAIYIYSMYMYV